MKVVNSSRGGAGPAVSPAGLERNVSVKDGSAKTIEPG